MKNFPKSILNKLNIFTNDRLIHQANFHLIKIHLLNFSDKQTDKIFKLTFTRLDKFASMEELNSTLSQLSEIKVIRIHKLANKNYGHADIISKLDSNLLKFKFESLKILGKSMKVRIREEIDKPYESLLSKYIYFDFEKLLLLYEKIKTNEIEINSLKNDCAINLFEYIHHFYIKKLTDNPIAIKFLLNKFVGLKNDNSKEFDKEKIDSDCIGKDKLFDLVFYDKEIYNYEFYINYNFNFALNKKHDIKIINQNSNKSLGKNSMNKVENNIFIPMRSNLLKKENDESNEFETNNPTNNNDDIKIKFFDETNKNEKLNLQYKRINTIFTKLIDILMNLEYTSYIKTKDIPNGVYRNLNIKFNEEKIMITLMISTAKITMIDLKIIMDALKYEFSSMSNYLNIYISFNEKVIAETKNSNCFINVLGNINHLLLLNNIEKIDNSLKIYPFDDNENLNYFKDINIKNIFSTIGKSSLIDDNFKFKFIFDITSNFTPYSYLLNIKTDQLVFFKSEYNFNLLLCKEENFTGDIKEILNQKKNIERNNILMSLGKQYHKNDYICDDNSYSERIKINKINEIEKDFCKSKFSENDINHSLLIFNLKHYDSKINKMLKNIRYQIIISSSFSQILDYIKNISNPEYIIKDLKIRFFKDRNSEDKDVLLFIEIEKLLK